jgi:hypothetical protein
MIIYLFNNELIKINKYIYYDCQWNKAKQINLKPCFMFGFRIHIGGVAMTHETCSRDEMDLEHRFISHFSFTRF